MATTYKAIASQVLASSTATITFSSIPGTYTDLVLKISARGDNAGFSNTVLVYYNSTSGTAGSYTNLYVGSGSVGSNVSSGAAYISPGSVNGATSTASTFGISEVYIPNYATAVAHQAHFSALAENNSSSVYYLDIAAGLNTSASAITSLIITANSSNFVSGSRFDLYGITHF